LQSFSVRGAIPLSLQKRELSADPQELRVIISLAPRSPRSKRAIQDVDCFCGLPGDPVGPCAVAPELGSTGASVVGHELLSGSAALIRIAALRESPGPKDGGPEHF